MDMLLPINGAVFATFFVLAADRIPAFNVEPHCRTIARRTGDSKDWQACLQQEQDAKEKVRRQWAQFTAAEKSYCVGLPTLGGYPIYTELLTCLELQRYVRKLRERNEGGAVKQGRR